MLLTNVIPIARIAYLLMTISRELATVRLQKGMFRWQLGKLMQLVRLTSMVVFS